MATTLRALLQAPELRLRVVVVEAGEWDRPVAWAHTTELLDPRPYLRGDGLVCTVGAALVDAGTCRRFVAALVDAGVAGVCFGVGDVHADVPPDLVEACRGRLPLVAAPLGVPFLAIADHLAGSRAAAVLAQERREAQPARERDRVGQLLGLVADRLASPLALSPVLVAHGLAETPLVVSAWPADAARQLSEHLEGAVVGTAPGSVLALTRGHHRLVTVGAELDLPCGYTHPVELVELARGVARARAALELARRRGGAVGPGALTTLAGLLEHQPVDRLRPFVDELVAPLLAADRQHGTNQLQTLRTFLDTDGSLQATARAQFLHVNTVRHRLDRIRRLVGRDPLVFDDRAALAIALWAFDRQQHRSSVPVEHPRGS